MVKLHIDPTPSELKEYFDYDNNFKQLLQDYLHSTEVNKLFKKSKNKNRSQFIRLMKHQLKQLYGEDDEEKPRIILFKQWMGNEYEMKTQNQKRMINNYDNDEVIRNLQNELKLKDKHISDLKNENQHYCKKINKQRNEIKSLKDAVGAVSPLPSETILMETPCEIAPSVTVYDSDDDISEDIIPPITLSPLYPIDEPSPSFDFVSTQQQTESSKHVSPSLRVKKIDETKEQLAKFIKEKELAGEKKRKLKEEGYSLEKKYIESLEGISDLNKNNINNIRNDYCGGELDIDEVEIQLKKIYYFELNKLENIPYVDITRLTNKANRYVMDFKEDWENL